MFSYKLKWKVQSPYGTPPQSDTVFGHIAWAIVYLYGTTRLTQILDRLAQAPGLVCSSLFPEGRLPIPMMPMTKAVKQKWLSQTGKDSSTALKAWTRLMKDIKRIHTLPEEMLTGHKEITWLSLIQRLEEEASTLSGKKAQSPKTTIFHNSINRLTSTTDESTGGPFAEVATWVPAGSVLQSWIDCSEDLLKFSELEQVCAYLSESGFGKNKSTGRGKMDISIEPIATPEPTDAKVWMLISNMAPAPEDSTDCHYSSLAKFPRMGGGYAQTGTPFKNPIFVMTPGSVFRGKKPIGTLLKGIHPELSDVVQNLYAYSIPIRIGEE